MMLVAHIMWVVMSGLMQAIMRSFVSLSENKSHLLVTTRFRVGANMLDKVVTRTSELRRKRDARNYKRHIEFRINEVGGYEIYSLMYLDSSSTDANKKDIKDAKKACFKSDKVDGTDSTSWGSTIVDIQRAYRPA